MILAIARKLSVELRRRDPVAERVVLSKAKYVGCCLRGVVQVLLRRALGRTHPSAH